MSHNQLNLISDQLIWNLIALQGKSSDRYFWIMMQALHQHPTPPLSPCIFNVYKKENTEFKALRKYFKLSKRIKVKVEKQQKKDFIVKII